MPGLPFLAYFTGAVVLTNAVPHLVSGLMGRRFQTPFATPPGRGLSSSSVNVLWAFLNLVIGYLLICHIGAFELRRFSHATAAGLGVLSASLLLARQFGRLHGGNAPGGS